MLVLVRVLVWVLRKASRRGVEVMFCDLLVPVLVPEELRSLAAFVVGLRPLRRVVEDAGGGIDGGSVRVLLIGAFVSSTSSPLFPATPPSPFPFSFFSPNPLNHPLSNTLVCTNITSFPGKCG